jgi:hypothetical protein
VRESHPLDTCGFVWAHPHVRIRPNGAPGEGLLCVFDLNFELERIDVLRASIELLRHLDWQHSAVELSVKGRLSDGVAARDTRTSGRLADQYANEMQKVDVVACEVMNPLEGCQGWRSRAVASPA